MQVEEADEEVVDVVEVEEGAVLSTAVGISGLLRVSLLTWWCSWLDSSQSRSAQAVESEHLTESELSWSSRHSS